ALGKTRGVSQQLMERDPRLVWRGCGKETGDRIFHLELALHLQPQHRRRGEWFADRGDVEERVGGERRSPGAVRQAVALIENDLAVPGHQDRARVAVAGELGEIAVEGGA